MASEFTNNVIDKIKPLLNQITEVLKEEQCDELLSMSASADGYAYVMLKEGSMLVDCMRTDADSDWNISETYRGI